MLTNLFVVHLSILHFVSVCDSSGILTAGAPDAFCFPSHRQWSLLSPDYKVPSADTLLGTCSAELVLTSCMAAANSPTFLHRWSPNELEHQRMVRVGWEFWKNPSSSRDNEIRVTMTMCRQLLKISKEKIPQFLVRQCQCSGTLTAHKCFLMARHNLFCSSLIPLPIVLTLGTTGKSLGLFSLFLWQYIDDNPPHHAFSAPNGTVPAPSSVLSHQHSPVLCDFPCFWPCSSHMPTFHSYYYQCFILTDYTGRVVPSVLLDAIHVKLLCAAEPSGSIINGAKFIFFHCCWGRKMWNVRQNKP